MWSSISWTSRLPTSMMTCRGRSRGVSQKTALYAGLAWFNILIVKLEASIQSLKKVSSRS